MEGHIRLRWTSHQGTLLSVFDALLSSESLVDVTLACDGQYIRAHKVILSACSPYFQDLINIDLNKHPIFFLKDITYSQLQALVQYMYRGEVNIAHDQLPSLLKVAKALQIRGLAEVETANNSITSDTLILPPQPTPTARPPPVVVPVPPQTVSAVASPVAIIQETVTVKPILVPPRRSPTATPSTRAAPPAKKSRHSSRSSEKTGNVLDANALPQCSVQLMDLQSCIIPTPSTSNHSLSVPSPGHSRDMVRDHGQVIDNRNGHVADAAAADVMKSEESAPPVYDLEDDEQDLSMSQSSFSQSWQECDNSMLDYDDEAEVPGGSLDAAGGGSNSGGGDSGSGVEPDGCEDPSLVCLNTFCGRSYKSRGALARHLRFECNQKPKFRCPCGKAFKRSDLLLRHTATCRVLKTDFENCLEQKVL